MEILAIAANELGALGLVGGTAAGLVLGIDRAIAFTRARGNGKKGNFDPVLCNQRGERLAVIETATRVQMKNIERQLEAIFKKLDSLK